MLQPGDRIEFTVTEHVNVLLEPLTRRVDDLFGRLQTPGHPAHTNEAMDTESGLFRDRLYLLRYAGYWRSGPGAARSCRRRPMRWDDWGQSKSWGAAPQLLL